MTINAHSFHRETAELLAENWAQTEVGAKRLAMAYLATRDERISYHMNIFGQPYRGWTMGQLFCLYCLLGMYSNGSLAIAEFELSGPPFRDRERAKNAEILEELRPLGYATVDAAQRGAEGDGIIEWTADFAAIIEPGGKKEDVLISSERKAILEIGNTDASNICLQLLDCGVVARWPYGHRKLVVLAEYPRDGVINDWRWDAPSEAMEDLGEFANIIALNRLSRTLAQRMIANRPSAEEREQNARHNFAWGTTSP